MSGIYTIMQLKILLLPIFKQYNVKKAILFGSYSKGLANANSDVDLLVDSGLRGLKFIGLLEDIQELLGKKVDLLDITHIDANSRIEQEIKRTGIIVYEK